MTHELPPRGTPQDFVRPFVITGGRTRAADTSLRMETMVQTVGKPRDDLNFEKAGLVVPLGVAMVIVGDLVDDGCLETTDPVEIELSTITRMIERVRAL